MVSSSSTGIVETNDNNVVLTDDPMVVRKWLSIYYPKQLSLLDKFQIELRLGQLLSSSTGAGSSGIGSNQQEGYVDGLSPRLIITLKTLALVKNILGATRWKNAAQVLTLLRGLGRELHAAGGFKEPVIENTVRRVMAAVREEVLSCPQADSASRSSSSSNAVGFGGRLSLESMLWALPQQHSRPRSRSASLMAGESPYASASETEPTGDSSGSSPASFYSALSSPHENYPPAYYAHRSELKHSVMENLQEISTELEDVHKNINDQAMNHIHAGEIILTYGRSITVLHFLKAAATSGRKFQVIVCEGAPNYGGHELAKSLAEFGIDTVVINDSATYAIMARVNKVLLPAHGVLANGGLITNSGCNMVALCAHNNSVPVVCLTGMFKLCPMYPHEGQDTLNDLLSPSAILDYTEMTTSNGNIMEQVQLFNPLHDYIKPEHINLYVTNVGSFQPSYIYRLLAEYYHTDDWESFE